MYYHWISSMVYSYVVISIQLLPRGI